MRYGTGFACPVFVWGDSNLGLSVGWHEPWRAFPCGGGGRQVVKSSATLFRDKIKRREIIQTFTRTGIDEMNNSNKLVFRNE